jgi:Na+-driven multidrug efflux pump
MSKRKLTKKKKSTKKKKKKHKFDAEALKRIIGAGVKSGILKRR